MEGLEVQTQNPKRLISSPFVLIIDDDEHQLAIFKTLFEQSGYNVVCTNSAKDALNILDEVHIELVVCDVNMPQMDGKEFIESVRKRSTLKHLPVISFSAAQRYTEEQLLASGADAFCSKQHCKRLLKQAQFLISEQHRNCDLLSQIKQRFC